MAIITWTPPVLPSRGFEKITTPKFIASDFGDGYSAIAPAGINNQLLDPLELVFADISITDAESMNTFMKTQNGDFFMYTLPLESTPRKFRGFPFKITVNSVGNHAFTVTLKEQP